MGWRMNLSAKDKGFREPSGLIAAVRSGIS